MKASEAIQRLGGLFETLTSFCREYKKVCIFFLKYAARVRREERTLQILCHPNMRASEAIQRLGSLF